MYSELWKNIFLLAHIYLARIKILRPGYQEQMIKLPRIRTHQSYKASPKIIYALKENEFIKEICFFTWGPLEDTLSPV